MSTFLLYTPKLQWLNIPQYINTNTLHLPSTRQHWSHCSHQPPSLSQLWGRVTVQLDRHSPLWFGVRWPLPAGCWWTLPWPCRCCREPGSPSPRSLGSCWVYRLVSLCSCGQHNDTLWLSLGPRAAGSATNKPTLHANKNVQRAFLFFQRHDWQPGKATRLGSVRSRSQWQGRRKDSSLPKPERAGHSMIKYWQTKLRRRPATQLFNTPKTKCRFVSIQPFGNMTLQPNWLGIRQLMDGSCCVHLNCIWCVSCGNAGNASNQSFTHQHGGTSRKSDATLGPWRSDTTRASHSGPMMSFRAATFSRRQRWHRHGIVL